MTFPEDKPYIILDTETCGSNAIDPNDPNTEIIEIVILAPDGSALLESFIKPVHAISERMTAFHGIGNEDVKDAPTFPEIYPQIVEAIQGKTVVVYNVGYDITLLTHLARRHSLTPFACDAWCLMEAYANYYKAPPRFNKPGYAWQSLDNACKQQGIPRSVTHRARQDAWASLTLLRKLEGKL
jgi:DNA polymerase-3 subunit epsilon